MSREISHRRLLSFSAAWLVSAGVALPVWAQAPADGSALPPIPDPGSGPYAWIGWAVIVGLVLVGIPALRFLGPVLDGWAESYWHRQGRSPEPQILEVETPCKWEPCECDRHELERLGRQLGEKIAPVAHAAEEAAKRLDPVGPGLHDDLRKLSTKVDALATTQAQIVAELVEIRRGRV